MNRDVFITCAVTGSGDTASRSDKVPITPEQIAESALDAARAGAAIVHIHVRDPETGAAGRNPKHFCEVVLERLRDDCLVSVMQALAMHDYAAGAILNQQRKAR